MSSYIRRSVVTINRAIEPQSWVAVLSCGHQTHVRCRRAPVRTSYACRTCGRGDIPSHIQRWLTKRNMIAAPERHISALNAVRDWANDPARAEKEPESNGYASAQRDALLEIAKREDARDAQD